MKALITITRLLVGLLFIFSGLVKANDPLGLAYKMDEFFAVWHWNWASAYSLYFSVAINVAEIVAGIALLLGYAPKLVTRFLLLLIVFFTFLTSYVLFSGKIKTCGCFGDCIPLTPIQTFTKDVLLLLMIVFLCAKSNLITPLFNKRLSLIIVLFFTGFFTFGQMNVLKHLPYVDCLPYAKSKNLLEEMQAPPGSIPDSVSIVYKYKKAGKEISFDESHFPDDFDDKVYEYIGRENVLVRKGNAERKIEDFALYAISGEDTTHAILEQKGRYIFFFAKGFNGEMPQWQEMFVKIYMKAREKKVPMYLITNEPQKAQTFFNETNHFAIPILRCDGTVMKTYLRSKVGVVAMDGATVTGKWSEADINDIIKVLNSYRYDGNR